MITVNILVDAIPVPKGRPKFARRGKFVTTYTPKKTADYEKKVAGDAKVSMKGEKPLEGALKCVVTCFMPIPKGTSKVKQAKMLSNEIYHTKKPDVDNLFKAATDPLSGIVFLNDSQIVDGRCSKRYSDYPRTEIIITEL